MYASVIEAKIMAAHHRSQIVKCEKCVGVFIENPLLNDDFIRFKARSTNLLQPCQSTFEICKFANSFLKAYEGNSIPYTAVAKQILSKITFEGLYGNSNFDDHVHENVRRNDARKDDEKENEYEGHCRKLVSKIVDLFLRLKSMEVAKKLTLQAHDNRLRHQMKKLIQERGE